MYISIIYLKIAIKIEVKLIFFSCLNVANISNFDKICKLSTVSMCKIFRACKFHYCLGGCFKYANLCLTFAFFIYPHMLQPLDTLARGTADKGQIHNVS